MSLLVTVVVLIRKRCLILGVLLDGAVHKGTAYLLALVGSEGHLVRLVLLSLEVVLVPHLLSSLHLNVLRHKLV